MRAVLWGQITAVRVSWYEVDDDGITDLLSSASGVPTPGGAGALKLRDDPKLGVVVQMASQSRRPPTPAHLLLVPRVPGQRLVGGGGQDRL